MRRENLYNHNLISEHTNGKSKKNEVINIYNTFLASFSIKNSNAIVFQSKWDETKTSVTLGYHNRNKENQTSNSWKDQRSKQNLDRSHFHFPQNSLIFLCQKMREISKRLKKENEMIDHSQISQSTQKPTNSASISAPNAQSES